MTTENTVRPDSSVTDEAWRWVAKLDELSIPDRLQLNRWLDESAVHREEFEAARREWQSFGILQQLKRDRVDRGDPWVAKKRVRRERAQRYYVPLAAAATLAAMTLAIWWVIPHDFRANYHTAIGEQQNVGLPDESAVMLNTNTRLTVHFTGEERTVQLERGEAHFDVTHDPARPFVVVAGTGIVRVVGTAFNVNMNEERVEVTVTDGTVEIFQKPEQHSVSAPASELLARSRNDSVQRLTEGHNARITDTIETVAAVDPETLERTLAWQHGMLEFVNAPLSEVIAEAGRYTVKTLVIADPALEAHRVTVIARANNIDRLLRNLDDSNDAIDVRHISQNRVLISSARPQ